jgi:ABC-2 type transport system permease protein
MGVRTLSLIWAYFKPNLAAAMEYRVSFLAQALGMILNDLLAFFFCWIYFQHFPQIGGWGMWDLLLVWGVAATAFGLLSVVFGNWLRLSNVISQGQLDYYLGLPWNPLLHVLVSRMSLPGWGDIAFGLAAFGLAAWLGELSIGLAVVVTLCSLAVMLGFTVLVGSLAFFIGSAENAAFQARDGLLLFATYPGSIFHGAARVLLMTLIPAAFVSHIPVELLREFDPGKLALLITFTAGLWALTLLVFQLGLRRYESGNLIGMRG